MYSRKDILLGDNGKIEKLSTMSTTATATPDFSSSNTSDDGNKENIAETVWFI